MGDLVPCSPSHGEKLNPECVPSFLPKLRPRVGRARVSFRMADGLLILFTSEWGAETATRTRQKKSFQRVSDLWAATANKSL